MTRTGRGEGPWFGDPPEALLLLEAGLPESEEGLGLLDELASGAGGPAGVEISVGFGRPFFDRPAAGAGRRRPRGLDPLRFHGDDAVRPGLAEEAGEVLLAAGGPWEATLEATARLRRELAARGARVVAVNLGSRLAGGRDHTGFFDGTSNLQELDDEAWRRCLFVQPEDGDPWPGATHLVFRKYEEDLTMWSTLETEVQEGMIGRRKGSGAFLDDAHEWSPESWRRTPPTAHVRRAHPRRPPADPALAWRERIFRRSIPYQETRGREVVCGVLFLALARDPHLQVERIHNERLLPAEGEGPKDFFLGSGYVVPRRSVSYWIPPSLPDFLAVLGSAPEPRAGGVAR